MYDTMRRLASGSWSLSRTGTYIRSARASIDDVKCHTNLIRERAPLSGADRHGSNRVHPLMNSRDIICFALDSGQNNPEQRPWSTTTVVPPLHKKDGQYSQFFFGATLKFKLKYVSY